MVVKDAVVFVPVVSEAAPAETSQCRDVLKDIRRLLGKDFLCSQQRRRMQANGFYQCALAVLPRLRAIVAIHLAHVKSHGLDYAHRLQYVPTIDLLWFVYE